MAELKQIKNRISSVKNTAQITKAMQMISASKMIKAQEKAISALPYSELLYEIVNNIGSIKDYKSVYIQQPSKVNNIALVVIGSSRGFVGGMLANLTNTTYKLRKELLKNILRPM